MVADTAAPQGLIERLIRYCAQNPLITLLLIAASGFWGYRALMDTPLDAVPDLSEAVKKLLAGDRQSIMNMRS